MYYKVVLYEGMHEHVPLQCECATTTMWIVVFLSSHDLQLGVLECALVGAAKYCNLPPTSSNCYPLTQEAAHC